MYTLQPPAPKPNGLLVFLAIIGVVALATIGLFAFANFVGATPYNVPSPQPSTRQVTYKITTDRDWGSCYGFDVTYEMPGGTSQRSVSLCDGDTNGVVDQRTAHPGDFVYLAVQNDNMAARIGCEIHVDGRLVYQTYSQGQYVIASCSGSVPD